ncbi:MAG: hypothetical protein AAF654_15035 [Myxococcota bacterium]
MKRPSQELAFWIVFAGTVGCSGEVSAPLEGMSNRAGDTSGDEPGGSDGDDGQDNSGACDVQALFTRYSCTGCHDETPGVAGAGLDLLSPSLVERTVGLPSSNLNCGDDVIIDLETPEASLLLRSVDPVRYADFGSETCEPARMPFGTGGVVSEADVDCLESWIRGLAPPGEPVDRDPPVLGDAFTVASRVKYLIDGGPLTNQELQAVTAADGTILNAELEDLVEEWMWTTDSDGNRIPTDSFFEKRRQFLELTLQQRPTSSRYFYQLRNASSISANLRESFVRTAERIIDNEEDFRSIANTNRWEVTTGVLMALTLTDHNVILNSSRVPEKSFFGNNINNLYGAEGNPRHLNRENDVTDWRTVTLITESSDVSATIPVDALDPAVCGLVREAEPISGLIPRDNDEPRIYDWTIMHPGTERYPRGDEVVEEQDVYEACIAEHTQYVRSIRDGDYLKLRAPRVGFFTTPAFFATWETNADNQFRVTVNQAMIVGAGRFFSPGDSTPVNTDLSAIDLVQFPVTSECYGCHKNLDRMRTAFTAVYDGVYSRHHVPSESVPTPDFTFQGQSVAVSSLTEWADALASHPEFGRAWVLKVCQWATGVVCDPNSEGVLQLAAEFESSGYRLNELLKRFFSSQLMSDTSFEEGTRRPGAQVGLARKGHFCHSMRTRLLRVNETRDNVSGQNSSAADVCELNAVESLSGSIPNDQFTRGTVELNQPKLFGALTAVAFEGLCTKSANALVEDRRRAVFNAGNPTQTLNLFASHILGFPAGSARFDAERAVLQRLYDAQTTSPACSSPEELNTSLGGSLSCGLELSGEDALRNIWSIVCQSPTLTGLGI